MLPTRQYLAGAILGAAASPCLALPLGDSGFALDSTLSVLSDYRSRGISQTGNDPAVQGTSVLSHDSGAYLALFLSNFDMGGKARREWNYIAGWVLPLGEELSLDLGWAKYDYRRENALSYSEFYGALSAHGVTLGLNYSDDVAGKESYAYAYLGYSHVLPLEVTLDLRYARGDFKDDTFFSRSGKGRSRYHDWQVSLSRNWLGLDWSASYIGTDLSRAECLSYSGTDDVCGDTGVLQVSKTF